MYNSQINTRYAKSLFLFAQEKNKLSETKKDIELILQFLGEEDDICTLLEHPIIDSFKKTEILTKIFKENIQEHTLSFLILIVKNKRENHLKNICKNFIDLYKRNEGIKTAVLTTSFDLTRTHEEKIRKSIEEVFKSKVELETKLDESIIGGMIIQVDDKQLDLSVARQIQTLRNQLINIDFNNRKRK